MNRKHTGCNIEISPALNCIWRKTIHSKNRLEVEKKHYFYSFQKDPNCWPCTSVKMSERQEKKLDLNKYKSDFQPICWQPCNIVWQTATNLGRKSVWLERQDGYRWKWLGGGAQPGSDRVDSPPELHRQKQNGGAKILFCIKACQDFQPSVPHCSPERQQPLTCQLVLKGEEWLIGFLIHFHWSFHWHDSKCDPLSLLPLLLYVAV